MSTFVIKGGTALKGKINVSSGKNSPLYLLAGVLLLRGKAVLKNVSRVDEVENMIKLLQSIGVRVEWSDERTLALDSSYELNLTTIDRVACKARASLLLLGALAARKKKYILYNSGGCKLGSRTIRPHVFALEKFGVKINSRSGFYEVENGPLKAAHVVMYESGDTGTANAILAAVLAPGKTTIHFASANYMVQDLCYFLVAAGAKIEGIGTTSLTITGVKKLHNVSEFFITPDPVDAMAWIALAITTKSPLTIVDCPLDFLELELEKLRAMGQKYEFVRKHKSQNKKFDLVDIFFTPSKLTALPDKIYGRPYPGLNIDNLPLFVPIATQANGRTLVHDWVYENRALYALELQKLGAPVMLLDPHRLLIDGPVKLLANEVICPPAIRPAMAILIAMCAARGKSILHNVDVIERGYENLLPRLQKVGVQIERID